jgi:hypothetical protein
MAYEIPAAIITTVGGIAGTLLAYYLPQRRAQKEARAAGLPDRTDANALQASVTLSIANSQLGNSTSTLPAKFKDFSDSVPFDTSISFAATNDLVVFRIPGNRRGVFSILFLSGWLIGWTVGIFVAATVLFAFLFKPDSVSWGSSGSAIFIAGWLIAAVAGEYFAIKGLIDALVVSFGNQYIAAFPDRLIIRRSLIVFGVNNTYAPQYIALFKPTDSGLQFEYGKSKKLISGPTEIESRWIAMGLSALYGIDARKIIRP